MSGSGGQVCTECHDDQSPGEGEEAHGAIERFGCQACHLPHGGDQARMLRVAGDDLCLGCHGVNTVEVPGDGSDATLLGRFSVSADELSSVTTVLLTRGNDGGTIEENRDHLSG